MFLNKSTIFQKTCPIPLDIAFFQIFYKLTWKNGTFKTVRQLFFFYAVLYPAFSTMLRLSHIAVQTSRTWLFMVTMFVTNLTVHSAWSEHGMINIFAWHFHNLFPFAKSTISFLCISLYHNHKGVETASFRADFLRLGKIICCREFS